MAHTTREEIKRRFGGSSTSREEKGQVTFNERVNLWFHSPQPLTALQESAPTILKALLGEKLGDVREKEVEEHLRERERRWSATDSGEAPLTDVSLEVYHAGCIGNSMIGKYQIAVSYRTKDREQEASVRDAIAEYVCEHGSVERDQQYVPRVTTIKSENGLTLVQGNNQETMTFQPTGIRLLGSRGSVQRITLDEEIALHPDSTGEGVPNLFSLAEHLLYKEREHALARHVPLQLRKGHPIKANPVDFCAAVLLQYVEGVDFPKAPDRAELMQYFPV